MAQYLVYVNHAHYFFLPSQLSDMGDYSLTSLKLCNSSSRQAEAVTFLR